MNIPFKDGLVFFLKYLGNVIVDHPNGEGTTAAAVKKIVAMSNVKLGGGNGGGAGGGKISNLIGGGVVGGKKNKLVKMEVSGEMRSQLRNLFNGRILSRHVSFPPAQIGYPFNDKNFPLKSSTNPVKDL